MPPPHCIPDSTTDFQFSDSQETPRSRHSSRCMRMGRVVVLQSRIPDPTPPRSARWPETTVGRQAGHSELSSRPAPSNNRGPGIAQTRYVPCQGGPSRGRGRRSPVACRHPFAILQIPDTSRLRVGAKAENACRGFTDELYLTHISMRPQDQALASGRRGAHTAAVDREREWQTGTRSEREGGPGATCPTDGDESSVAAGDLVNVSIRRLGRWMRAHLRDP